MPDIPPFPTDRQELSRALEQLGAPRLPGLLGIELLEITEGASSMRMEIGERHLASNGYLHAASVVALADTTAGYGCVANLPRRRHRVHHDRAQVESPGHPIGWEPSSPRGPWSTAGETTQVWDVVVTAEETAKKIALFRCTQMILYPR